MNMKRGITLVLIIAGLGGIVAGIISRSDGVSPTVAIGNPPPAVRIAIMPIQSVSTPYLTTLLMQHVGEIEDVELVERSEIDAIFDELALSQSGFVGTDDALAVGHLLGAEYFVLRGGGVEGDSVVTARLKLLHVPTGRVRIIAGTASDASGLAEDLKESVLSALEDDKKLREKSFARLEPAAVPDKVAERIRSMKPVITIVLTERHREYEPQDGSALNSAIRILNQSGFHVKAGGEQVGSYRLEGNVASDFGARRGELVSVIASADLRIIESATNSVIGAVSSDRISGIDLTEESARRQAVDRAVGEAIVELAVQFSHHYREP